MSNFKITHLISSVCLIALCLIGASTARAQSQGSSGQITGAVRDNAGAAVPNATVKAVNTQTGLERTATTSDDGIYRFVLMPPGTYNITAEASGFSPTSVNNVTVAVGQTVDANITVGVGGVKEEVTITAEGLQTTVSQPDALINESAINNLPINGRRFQDFVTLTPTAQVDPSRGQISLSGQRGINGNVNIDGMDYNQPFFGGIRGGERSNTAFTIPQESIKEFAVVAAGYSAEFGRSTGGVVTAVTKSGTNEYHGSAFYLLRHRELSRSNDYFDALEAQLGRKVTAAPTQQQYGGSFGGPIKKDKSFFFGSFEGQKVRNPRQVFFDLLQGFTPTAATQEAITYYQGLQTPFEQTNDVWAFLARFDHNFSDANRINIRYNQSNNNALNSNATGNQLFPTTVSALSNNGTEKDRTYTLTGQWTSFFRPELVNELRVQYSREVRPRIANNEAPNITNAIGRVGTVNFLSTTQYDWRFQAFNNLTWIAGNHTMKFGAEVNHVYADQQFAFNQFGLFNISGAGVSNVGPILDTLSYTPTITTGVVNRFDSSTVTYLRQIGNGLVDLSVDEFALYFQDAWRVKPNFTLNFGLRWEGQFNPAPEASNDTLINRVQGVTFPSGHQVNPRFIPDNTDQFGPRLGFAWDPWNDSKTVIRAYSGIYYARTPLLLFTSPLNNWRNPPGDVSIQLPISVSALPVGNPLRSCTTVYCQLKLIGVDLNTFPLTGLPVITTAQIQSIGTALGLPVDPFNGAQVLTWASDYKNPMSYQFGGGVERQIGNGLTVGIDYSQVNTFYLQRNRDVNMPRPIIRANDPAQRPYYGVRVVTGQPVQARPVSTLGSVQVRESTGRSVYQAMTLRANLRRKWAQFNVFYTLSRSLSDDDNERDSGGVAYDDTFNLRPEFSYSRLDRRHQFVASPVFFLPYGFEVSSAMRFRSGVPIDATVGFDANSDLGSGPDRPYSAPGVSFKRNGFRNLAVYDVDLRVQKGFSLGEAKRIIFSTEFFNLPNLKNLQLSGSQVTGYCTGASVTAQLDCGFGAPTNVNFLRTKDSVTGNYLTNNNPGAPFQVQFGLRFQF
jgi:hypothetical protein